MPIKRKIPFLLMTLIGIPLLLLVGIIYYYSSNILIARSKNSIEQVARAEQKAFQVLLDEREYELRLLASDAKIIDIVQKKENMTDETFYSLFEYEEVKQLLNRESEMFADFCEAFIVDTKGNVIAGSDDDVVGYNIRERRYYQDALKGDYTFSDIMISKMNHMPVIVIAVPIKNEHNEIIGVVCKTILNSCFSNFVNQIKVGKTGYGYLVDKNGYIIAHSNQNKEGLFVQNKTVRNIVKDIKQGKEIDPRQETYIYNGQVKYLRFKIIPDLEWVLCITQDLMEIKTQAYMEFFVVMGITLLLLAMIAVASMWITKLICDPIDKLTKTMHSVEAGNLKSFCEYNVDDEFGKLTKNYNAMISTLAESQEELRITGERYRMALEAVEETVWEYDLETEVFSASEKLNKIVGYMGNYADVKEIINHIINKDYVESFKEVIGKCLKGSQEIFSEELLLKPTKEGEKRWILCRGKVLLKENKPAKFMGVITDITALKANEEKVRKLVYYDTLTGLFNKQTFMDILKEWVSPVADCSNSALFFIDLDNFKNLNDTLGHEVGDKLLNFVGRRLKAVMPSDTLICRFGGDEFVVFKNHFKILDEVYKLAEDILEMLKENIIIDDKKIHISCSIGIALYPLDGLTSEELLKNADTAMNKAKSSGKNRYNFYDEDMSKSLDRKVVVERAIREALVEGKFFLQYQPIIELKTGKVVAAEALLRMNSEELGFVSPAEFIPVAEETGLIVAVGEWVLETALKELERCKQMGYENFSMSINVSAIQIAQFNYIDRLKYIIDKYDVPVDLIKLEITESVLMENLERNIELFNELKDLGIHISLDDFGTGYSSLNYLRNLPFDILKIDKTFIDEVSHSDSALEIVESIINMAHTLGIKVIAEGVESEEQLDLVIRKKCDMVQGYIFSKSLVSEDLEGFIKANDENRKSIV